jgi:hypothetical protein
MKKEMFQVENVKDVFQKYFGKAVTPDRIIELGTYKGTFSKMIYDLRREINHDFDFHTFDNINNLTITLPVNMHFYCIDIFENINFIAGLIKENTLILCDNGNKIAEVNILAPYLKKDCVIMAHDYFYDRKDFEDNKYRWLSCEITHDDVKDLQLEPYFQELMIHAAWLSLMKM